MIDGSLRGKKYTREQAKTLFGNNFNRRKVNPKTQLRESWVWSQKVEKLVKSRIIGKSLNVCCGLSEIGDVKVDIAPLKEGIIKADMNELPFKDNSFDTVVSDPPWKLNFFKRMRPFFECVRVCKVGGRVIYNATWIPTFKYVELKEVIIRQENSFTNCSIISIFEKTADISKPAKLLSPFSFFPSGAFETYISKELDVVEPLISRQMTIKRYI